jgi:hypothetical protein
VFEPHLSGSAGAGPLVFVGSGVHRCTFTNALAETIAQQESSDASQFGGALWREGHS